MQLLYYNSLYYVIHALTGVVLCDLGLFNAVLCLFSVIVGRLFPCNKNYLGKTPATCVCQVDF